MVAFAFLLALKFTPPVPDVKFQQPQVTSTGDMIALTFGSGNDIYYTYSTNDGGTFSRPSLIETGGKLSLGRHRGPRIAIQSGGAVISAVVGVKGGGADGDLLAWRSTDNGKTWAKPVRINDVPGSAREGLHAMANGNGMIAAVWLDLREKGTRLYFSKSTDGGVTWSKNIPVYESPDGTICQCCHPSILITSEGAVHVMWRNALGGSRDMYYARSTDAGTTFSAAKKLGRETWKLNACPMDGGGFAVATSDRIFTVWRREKSIFVSLTEGKESELGQGKDPSIAAGMNDSVYAVWSSPDGLQVRSTKADAVKTLAPKGDYPQLLFTGRGVLAFWEQDGGIAMGTVEEPGRLAPTESR